MTILELGQFWSFSSGGRGGAEGGLQQFGMGWETNPIFFFGGGAWSAQKIEFICKEQNPLQNG